MKKQYTKKQIQEAITYWKQKLNEGYGPSSFMYGDGKKPITGKEFCEIIKNAIKRDIDEVIFRYANPKNDGNATQNLRFGVGEVHAWAEGMNIGWTSGQTIGNAWPFDMFMTSLKNACKGKKLSDIAKDSKAVGLMYRNPDHPHIKPRYELSYVITGVNIGTFGNARQAMCFYVNPIAGDSKSSDNDELGDDWI